MLTMIVFSCWSSINHHITNHLGVYLHKYQQSLLRTSSHLCKIPFSLQFLKKQLQLCNIDERRVYKKIWIVKQFQREMNTLQAVSNPKLVGTSLHLRSPSMVFGQPITLVFKFLLLIWKQQNRRKKSIIEFPFVAKIKNHSFPKYLKFSARRQAFVLESSPPITTSPSRSSFWAVSSACLNWKWNQTINLCLDYT